MTNCVDCPDDQNYAAIALQLQETALEAEECLYQMETSLRQVVNPETVAISMTGAQVVSNGVITRIGQGAGTVLFANSPRVNVLALTTRWTPGVWEIGACITATATGAVTVDSFRRLFLFVRRTSQNFFSYACSVTATEPNNGTGVDMTLVTTVVVEAEDTDLQFYFQHGNAGSTVSVGAGALFWATRLSDAQALRVV